MKPVDGKPADGGAASWVLADRRSADWQQVDRRETASSELERTGLRSHYAHRQSDQGMW